MRDTLLCLLVVCVLAARFATGCGGGGGDGDGDRDGDADAGVDGDADADADADADGDGDGDADADGHADADGDPEPDLTPDQQEIFAGADELHTGAGCEPFGWDARLARAAEVCAERMAETQRFDVCGDAVDRLADAGLEREDFRYVRQTAGFRQDIDTFVAELLDNEHVRDCGCTLAGVGVVHSETIFGGGYFACALYVAL